MFEAFLKACPPEAQPDPQFRPESVERYIADALKVAVPDALSAFWRACGSGYFGDRMLYFFGSDSAAAPRPSLAEWNGQTFWRVVYPLPEDSGPVFFAETSFGDQLGFRWEAGRCIFMLFLIDSFEAFVISDDGRHLFEEVLTDRYALVDRARHEAVRARLGALPAGMHYAPIVSPILGGSGDPGNFALETPKVHFATAIHAFSTGTALRIEV